MIEYRIRMFGNYSPILRRRRPRPVVVEGPSLPLWVSPEKDEPAHGILLRLAERNGIENPVGILNHTGLRTSDLRVGREVPKLAKLIRCSPIDILDSTFVAGDDGWCSVRGQRLQGRRDIEGTRRRLCPHCIAESPHQRFWFDVTFISTCPKHNIELISDCSCGHPLSWSDVRVSKCRHCENGDVQNIRNANANEDVLEVDRWILGRLGVTKSASIPVLDELPLTHAFSAITAVGALQVGGNETRKSMKESISTADVSINEARAAGFGILRDGVLDQLLDRVYARYRPYFRGASFHGAFSWFGTWFMQWHHRTASDVPHSRFADIVIANAARKSLAYRRKGSVNESDGNAALGRPGAG